MDNRKEMAKEGNGSALDIGHNVLCQGLTPLLIACNIKCLWIVPPNILVRCSFAGHGVETAEIPGINNTRPAPFEE